MLKNVLMTFLSRSRFRDRKHIFSPEDINHLIQLKEQKITDPLSFWEWIGKDINHGIQNLSKDASIRKSRLLAYLSDQVAQETEHSKGSFSETTPFLPMLIVGLVLVLMLITRLVFQGLPLGIGPFTTTAFIAARDLPAYTSLSSTADYTTRSVLVPIWQMAAAPGDVQNRYTLSAIQKGSIIMKTRLSTAIPAGQVRRIIRVPIPSSQINTIPPGDWADLLLTPDNAVPSATSLVRIQAIVLGYQSESVTVSIEDKNVDKLGYLLGTSTVYLVGR